MERRKFIFSSLLAAPVLASAKHLNTTSETPKPFTVKVGEARFGVHTPFRGVNPNDLKISKKDTDGAAAMFEYIGTEKTGPSLHIHLKQDEIFYVVEGEYLFKVGDEKSILKSGDSIFLPRLIPHTWLQLSDKGKLIYWVTPAGKMEDFFLKLNSLTKPPTPEEMNQIHADHDMKVVGPPLTF
jgi:mannose-6-phosphate isomerase-like protein (cupin superfamily)